MIRLHLILIIWCLTLLGSKNILAQPQPALSCLSVISETSVEVSWSVPAGAYDGVRIYYGPVGGSVNFQDINNNISTSATINSLNTTIRYEFFLATFINNIPISLSPESNRVQTMQLGVAGDGTGIARLDWNKQNNSDNLYSVYRSLDNVNFTLLTTTTANKYNDTINSICGLTSLYYRIENQQCLSLSNIAGGRFQDLTNPRDPVLSYVTIENGKTEVYWTPSSSSDVDSIIIERQIGFSFIKYATIARSTYFYDDASITGHINPCDNIVTYIIRAMDECGNESPGAINYLNPHNTILITGNTSELCERKAIINWNAYKNMQPALSYYKIERSVNGSPFIDIAQVQSTSQENYNFTDDEFLEPGVPVRYRVAAIAGDNSKLSHSCELPLLPQPELITNFEITNVTVSNNSFITLTIQSNPATVPHEVELFRTNEGLQEKIATFTWSSSSTYTFQDLNASVNSETYEYLAKALDDCGFNIASSNEFNSILLNISVSEDNYITLNWNHHEGWGYELQHYLLYKYSNGVLVSGYPVMITYNLNNYLEADNGLNDLNITFAVEAVSFDGRISRSNEVLLPRDADIKVPTAFRPNGINTTFKPVIRNIDRSNYNMSVYNRWGQKVFETNDLSEGWNGSVDGKITQGIYIYVLTYIDQSGRKGIKRGSVNLIM